MVDLTQADNPVRVLIIEDNVDDRDLLFRQLRKSGVESNVKFIADGQEALNFLLHPQVNDVPEALVAIFIDLKLPSISGLDILRQLRADEKLRALPVIVMTSSNNPKDLEECKKLAVTSFVSKPVSYAAFSKAVASVFHLPKK